jgi:class 3 adenylate cyclase/tetratricopeptide (TPR) repeat protein
VERDRRNWLKPLALTRFAEAHEANAITLDMLPRLSDAELTALGDRRRLALVPDRASDAKAFDCARSSQAPFTAERRWITVLFCDLVGSTELSDRLDPEDLREVLAQYQIAVVEAVQRYQGYVERFEGDGIIAYFGWPTANEDQAERAVRAGIAASEAVRVLSPVNDLTLHLRVGISTGEVVMDENGSGVGRSPNLAARLQGAAGPDQILIDAATRQEIGRRFHLDPLLPQSLKGLAEAVISWRVIAPQPIETRFEGREPSRTAFVGRTFELARLLDLWREVSLGAGRVILLSGEAGIGKSRLVDAMGDALVTGRFLRLNYQCSPLHVDTPLYPAIQSMEHSLGFEEGDNEATRAEKLQRGMGPIFPDDPHALTLFADLLSLPTNTHPRLPDEPPAARRDRLLSALCTLLIRLSEKQPLLAIIEDVHWINPSMLDLLHRVIKAIPSCKVMVIVTRRDSFGAEWTAEHVSPMVLGRLDEDESVALVRAHAGTNISAGFAKKIAAKADGVPLFVEEMTRAIMEQLTRGRGAAAAEADKAMPKTLQALLTSRLDNLGSAKSLAQTAAVIGRRFPLKLLSAVAEHHSSAISSETERLLRSELFLVRESASGLVLTFRHTLVQEAAYDSLLRTDRRRLHAAVVKSLEKLYPTRLEVIAETLAVHAERAEDWERAARYLMTAFMKAASRFARREAVSLYDRASKALNRLPFAAAAERAIDLRLHAFGVFQAIGETDTVVKIITEAELFAERFGDRRRLAAAAAQSAFALWMIGDHVTALKRAESSLEIARSLQDFPLSLVAQYNLASVRYLLGDLSGGIALHRMTIDMLPGDLATKRFGWQAAPGLITRSFLGAYLLDSGDFNEARRLFEECRLMLASVDRSFSRVLVEGGFGLYHLRRGDFEEAVPHLRAALDLSETGEVLTMSALFAAWLGEALTGAGCPLEALAVISDAVARKTYRFCPNSEKHLRLALAEARFVLGDREAAFRELQVALDLTKSCNEVLYHSQAVKLRGDFLLAQADAAEAHAAYRQAMEVAEPRGSRLLAAHCKVGLGKCAQQRGNNHEAGRWLESARQDFRAMGAPYWAMRYATNTMASEPKYLSSHQPGAVEQHLRQVLKSYARTPAARLRQCSNRVH